MSGNVIVVICTFNYRLWEKNLHKLPVMSKLAGYAGHNAESPLENFYACDKYLGVNAFEGCLVRLCDKYERIRHLREDSGNDKVNESIIETANDLVAYALIATILYI